MLKSGAEEHPAVSTEDILGAVGVMHIEIDDGDTLEAMDGNRVRCADGDVVEKTEPHGAVPLRMMARRPDSTKGTSGLAGHHHVNGLDIGARCIERGLEGVGIHRRVAVEPDQPLVRCSRMDLLDIERVVHALDLLPCCRQGVPMQQKGLDTGSDQLVTDGMQACRLFRVMRSHRVLQKHGMRDVGD